MAYNSLVLSHGVFTVEGWSYRFETYVERKLFGRVASKNVTILTQEHKRR
jgi:hypothetical protein